MRVLPGAVDAERSEVFSFFLFEVMLDDTINARPTRSASKTGTQLREVIGHAGSDHFNVSIFGVAHPAAQFEFGGLALHEPAKPYTLYATLNEEVANHRHRTKASVADGKLVSQLSPINFY